MGCPDVVLPLTVKIPAHVGRLLLVGMETVRSVPQSALDVCWESLAWQLIFFLVHHLGPVSVVETLRLAAGEESVEVGAGA